MSGQSFLYDYEEGDDDGEPGEGDCPRCGGSNTSLWGESSPRLTPEGHKWEGTRPRWCSDCLDVVERVGVADGG